MRGLLAALFVMALTAGLAALLNSLFMVGAVLLAASGVLLISAIRVRGARAG